MKPTNPWIAILMIPLLCASAARVGSTEFRRDGVSPLIIDVLNPERAHLTISPNFTGEVVIGDETIGLTSGKVVIGDETIGLTSDEIRLCIRFVKAMAGSSRHIRPYPCDPGECLRCGKLLNESISIHEKCGGFNK